MFLETFSMLSFILSILGRSLVRLVEEHLWFVAMSTELLEKGVLVVRYSSWRFKLHSMRLQRELHGMNLLTASML